MSVNSNLRGETRLETLAGIEDLRKAYYGYDKKLHKKEKQHLSLDELEHSLESGAFRCDIQDYRFECLYRKSKGKNLYVTYNGARIKNKLPRFPRWSYHNLFSGSMLCIEDPQYFMYPNLNLGWFYGNEETSLLELSLEIVKAVCRREKRSYDSVIFMSSSGGGYSSIYAASLLKGSLAIAMNPQIYIQDYVHTENFIQTTGIDLNKRDPLQRNDIPARIRKGSSSRYVLLFNAQSRRDFDTQAAPFLREMEISPQYGLVEKGPVLTWIYDCHGVPDPHTSWETKSIFAFIDHVAKEFYQGTLSERLKKAVLVVNECWHDIYSYKSQVFVNKEAMMPSCEFVSGGGCEFTQETEPSFTYIEKNILIKEKNIDYNYHRYPISKGRMHYLITISNIEADFQEYTVGVFDYINRKFLYYENKPTQETTQIRFTVGEHIGKIALCIYAGIHRHTKGKSMTIGRLIVEGRCI